MRNKLGNYPTPALFYCRIDDGYASGLISDLPQKIYTLLWSRAPNDFRLVSLKPWNLSQVRILECIAQSLSKTNYARSV